MDGLEYAGAMDVQREPIDPWGPFENLTEPVLRALRAEAEVVLVQGGEVGS
jgi:hypothetical protein